MGIRQDKELLIDSFEDFRNECERSQDITQGVEYSIKNTVIYSAGDITELSEDGVCVINLGKDTSWEDDERIYCGDNIGIVLKLSGVYPGDGVVRGVVSTEADLCRCSTLYFCLQSANSFYEGDKDSIILVPDVFMFKNGKPDGGNAAKVTVIGYIEDTPDMLAYVKTIAGKKGLDKLLVVD
ncbi:MAG: PARG family protein [Lachnospiraceae bacterium]|nr:PARG family protein [Lachnospiraceae bacterium]